MQTASKSSYDAPFPAHYPRFPLIAVSPRRCKLLNSDLRLPRSFCDTEGFVQCLDEQIILSVPELGVRSLGRWGTTALRTSACAIVTPAGVRMYRFEDRSLRQADRGDVMHWKAYRTKSDLFDLRIPSFLPRSPKRPLGIYPII